MTQVTRTLQSVPTRTAIPREVQPILGSVIVAALFGGEPLDRPPIEAEPIGDGPGCDVTRVYTEALGHLQGKQRSWIISRLEIVAERLTDHTWDFHVFLRDRRRRSAVSWHLHATTCGRALRRTALKLKLISDALLLMKLKGAAPKVPEPDSGSGPDGIDEPGQKPPELPSTESEGRSQPRPAETGLSVVVPEPPPKPSPEPPRVDPGGEGPRMLAPGNRRVRRSPLGLRVRLTGRGGYGIFPQRLFGGVQVHAAFVSRRARLELGVSFGHAGQFTVTKLVTRQPEYVGVQLRGCGEFGHNAFDLRLCAGVEGGALILQRDRSQPFPWTVAAMGGPALTWWFHRHVGLYAGIDAGMSVVRPNFYVGPGPGDEALGERITPRLLLTGALGVEFRGRRP